MTMYRPVLELLPASKCGSTFESGTERGSMLLVGLARGTAFGSMGDGSGATATAAAVAALALAAAAVMPADFDGVGFGGSAIAMAVGAAAGAGLAATGAGGGGGAIVDVFADVGTGSTIAAVDGWGAAFGLKRFEIWVTVQRAFGSRRKVLRAMSR
jgi:hypothetical protein